MGRTGRAVVVLGQEFDVREYLVPDPEPGAVLLRQEAGRDLRHRPAQLAERGGERSDHGAIDRNEYDWRTFDMPFSVMRGALAESWETPDPTTIIAHIRQGVHWHDKAPMNGRELTASDVEFNYHRLYGLGSGFTEAGSFNAGIEKIVESVTATDASTVVFKLTNPDINALQKIFDWWTSVIYPPEVIKQHGHIKDWRTLVGTGPMELTDVVEGASLKWTRVPDYWGFDEKFPDNRLPYVDEINALYMSDPAARLAALRSGKVDMLGTVGDSQVRSIDQMKSLDQTNPEINTWGYQFRSEHAFAPNNISKPPFNDIRVRRAMQMALDLETISATYFSGLADPTPQGFLNNAKVGIGTPFEEWPEEIKPYYRYDPEGAKQLLAEAGYPDGFSTRLDYLNRFDLNYVELAANYWREIAWKSRSSLSTVRNTRCSCMRTSQTDWLPGLQVSRMTPSVNRVPSPPSRSGTRSHMTIRNMTLSGTLPTRLPQLKSRIGCSRRRTCASWNSIGLSLDQSARSSTSPSLGSRAIAARSESEKAMSLPS